jgi:hypothetical protein
VCTKQHNDVLIFSLAFINIIEKWSTDPHRWGEGGIRKLVGIKIIAEINFVYIVFVQKNC